MSVLQWGKIHCVPSFHNRLQFAREVRRVFEQVKPDIVAIELPDIYYSDLLQGLDRLPKMSLLCLQQSDHLLSYLPIFPSDSMIEAVRLARDNRLPSAMIDLAVENYNIQIQALAAPDDEAIEKIGMETYYQLVLPYIQGIPANPHDQQRESHMAARLMDLSQRFERILLVCGMSHWPGIQAHLQANSGQIHEHALESVKSPFLAKLGPKARHLLLEEMPYLVMHYELSRRFHTPFDKDLLLRKILQEARLAPHLKEEAYSPRELKNVLQYAYKLAVSDKRISPDLYNLLLSCKLTLGDDYALEVMDRALAYPYEDQDDLPEIDFDPNSEAFWMAGRKITLQRRLPLPIDSDSKHHWQDLQITRKKKEELPPHFRPFWFFFGGFYSHLPEDLILEGFIERLEDKLSSEPQATQTRLHEFSGSLMDGLDMRETIRHHPFGKIYVREELSNLQAIGAWILIFDEDLSFRKYPWMLSLSAEHHNESDIAFYASNPAIHPVTRDIIRAQYGALLAIKPALRLDQKIDSSDLDIDEDLRKEQLIRLAIQLSPKPGVLYFAEKAPEDYFFELAKHYGKRLFHLPLGRVSQRKLKRIQRFHLLSRRDIRDIAEDYI